MLLKWMLKEPTLSISKAFVGVAYQSKTDSFRGVPFNSINLYLYSSVRKEFRRFFRIALDIEFGIHFNLLL